MKTEQELLQNKTFKKLLKLPLLQSDYVIMGSGIMFALGIRDLSTLDNIDIMVTVDGWNKVNNLSEIIHDDKWNCDHIYLFNNEIEIYNGWGPSYYDIKQLLKDSYKVGSFNFMSLKDVIRWKNELGREKDKIHLQMIDKFLKKNPHFIKKS